MIYDFSDIDAMPLLKSIEAYLIKADEELADALEEGGFLDAAETVEEMSVIEEMIAQALLFESERLFAALEECENLAHFAQNRWPHLKETDNCDDEIGKQFFVELMLVLPSLVYRYMAEIDPELANTKPIEKAFGSEQAAAHISNHTVLWAADWSSELADIMKLNTHNLIETQLSHHLANGKSIEEFTQFLMDSGIRDEYFRARRVAQTEMLAAHSVAQQEAYTQSPAVEMKMWRHTGAHKNEPRPNHMAMSGTTVPKNEPFRLVGADGGVYSPMYPRDSYLPPGERINCKCITQPVVSDEALGMSLEERQELQDRAIMDSGGYWEMDAHGNDRWVPPAWEKELRDRLRLEAESSAATR